MEQAETKEQNRVYVTVHLSDGDTISTRFNGTKQEALAYYAIGTMFNNGAEYDSMVSVVSVNVDE